MSTKGVRARNKKKAELETLPPASIARRIGWVLCLGLWGFMVVALASFDSADAPSHAVAVHNQPAANLCGAVGAFIAYHAYHVIGIGMWVLIAFAAGALVVTVTGRAITHPLVRTVGVVFIALTISAMHQLLLPNAGPLPGARAGLIAFVVDLELASRFSTIGTLMILIASLAVGAIVAVDRLVLALPRAVLAALVYAREHNPLVLIDIRALLRRPELAAAGAGRKVARSGKNDGSRKGKGLFNDAIDPDAGGLGGTEAFDPDEEWEYEDEEDEDWEYVDEDDPEGEYEDDEENEYEDEEDGEWEYEDEEDETDEQEVPVTTKPRLTAEELRQKIARLPLRMGSHETAIARDEDIPREENFEGYQFPTLELLEDPESNFSEKMEAIVRDQAQQLEESLQTYGIDGEVAGIESGPTVTLFSVQLAPGTKVAKVSAIASDVARSLKAQNIRIVPNMKGKTTIGIEVPNLKKEKVRLKELMSGGHAADMRLPMFLGKDASGEPLVADLTRMPHMLIAGTTGSGKSVCMNTIIMSWLYTKRPDELKLVLVDPKMVELSQFGDIPHLMCPVVTEMGRAAAILEWAVNKMEERYELLKEACVRDIASYNELGEEDLVSIFEPESEEEKARIPKKLPYMVFVIDELADLILTNKEVEHSIVRIAQKARAVGIHLILATQRPQANVVTGLIKSNMPCRISFKVASGMDSRIVLDQKGAELLLGQGDMMFLAPSSPEIIRSQGTLVADGEIRKVARFLRDVAGPTFERSLIAIRPAGSEDTDAGLGKIDERDPLFDQAVEIMIETGRGSVSLLQRRLSIGYSRASRLVDQMGQAGILGDHRGSVARDVIITMEDWLRMKALEEGGDFDDDHSGDVAEIETTLGKKPKAVTNPSKPPFETDLSDELEDDLDASDSSGVPAEFGDEYLE